MKNNLDYFLENLKIIRLEIMDIIHKSLILCSFIVIYFN
jgi:hypothetical protein